MGLVFEQGRHRPSPRNVELPLSATFLYRNSACRCIVVVLQNTNYVNAYFPRGRWYNYYGVREYDTL